MVCIPYKSKFFATKREYSNARENIKDATSSENRVWLKLVKKLYACKLQVTVHNMEMILFDLQF